MRQPLLNFIHTSLRASLRILCALQPSGDVVATGLKETLHWLPEQVRQPTKQYSEIDPTRDCLEGALFMLRFTASSVLLLCKTWIRNSADRDHHHHQDQQGSFHELFLKNCSS